MNLEAAYNELKEAGKITAVYHSDLYVMDDEETRNILQKYHMKIDGHTISSFKDAVTGVRSLDIAFGNVPYWKKHGSTKA